MNDRTFFNKLVLKSGFNDEKIVKNIYFALVKTIISELKEKGEVYLPKWGMFRITIYKERRIGNISTGQTAVLGKTKTIKFSACRELKYYIKNMSTVLDLLD